MLPDFGVKVSVTFHLTCVYIIFSSVWVAEWPIAAHSVVILVISRFVFKGWIWVLIASVPDLCIFLAHLSRRLIGELIVYTVQVSSVRRPSTFSNDISSEAVRQILSIFHI